MIEITLALGLLAFVVTPMVGLMAIGLTTLRDSMADTTKAGIAKNLMREAELLSWTEVSSRLATAAEESYFTYDGRRQTTLNGGNVPSIYIGETKIESAPPPLGPLTTRVIVEVRHFQDTNNRLQLPGLLTRQGP